MRKPFGIAGLASLCGLLLLAAVAGGVYWASQRVPGFYREELDREPQVQRAASEAMLENASALASNVSKEGRWSALFTAEQINGWLAVDAVENHPDLLPADIADPRIRIQPGRATFACRHGRGSLSTVVTLSVGLHLVKPNVVALRIDHVRAGVLPIPLSQILDGVAEAARRLNVHLAWRQVDGDPVALLTIPPARDGDDTEYELEALELRDGLIYLAGRTKRGSPRGPLSAALGQTLAARPARGRPLLREREAPRVRRVGQPHKRRPAHELTARKPHDQLRVAFALDFIAARVHPCHRAAIARDRPFVIKVRQPMVRQGFGRHVRAGRRLARQGPRAQRAARFEHEVPMRGPLVPRRAVVPQNHKALPWEK